MTDLVVTALGRPRAEPLARVLAQQRPDAADFEASVRGGSGRVPRAGRMMIERASSDVLAAIAASLDVALPPAVSRWLDVAHRLELPIITGWDLRGDGPQRCAKLYLNASDASVSVRDALGAALLPGCDHSPAVVGMNVRADGVVETKLYLQSADAVALSAGLDEPARAIAAAARAEAADAGGVLALDIGPSLRPRALFVALREPGRPDGWACVRALPGYDPAACAALLPFAPAPPRSVGISLGSGSWTLYCKPRGSGRAPEALEPAAIFRCAAGEVGVFVEPTEHAARAFRRTQRHAISIRIRHGAPTPLALEALVGWFAARVMAAENTDLAIRVTDPPAPWCVVDASAVRQRAGGPA